MTLVLMPGKEVKVTDINAIPTLTGTKQHEAVTTVGSAWQTRLEAAVLVKRKSNLKTASNEGK